ncbi:RrF2 family transcriptional regulator [Flavobacterium silvaticum]|uniref:Rrf2 family transcriptional regulator n=1 Tax=Flavobacterium silvaticum TaxID=1852020 RepID=A0A972FWH4_9FLAO|nr:Rrf2 family transcriptional regulator [Flavobacterium silvaticum]NMH29302.1 Rrf2 family transcriptional regulator [Flavobacterium silvaticum]
MISGKFAISLHILTLLSRHSHEYLSSDHIAESLNMNPVLVRKEIANLKRFDIVESREGKNGGTRLCKPADGITLDEIFRMTFQSVSLGFSRNKPNPRCPIGRKINNNLTSLYSDINHKVTRQLSGVSLLNFADTF